MDSTKDTRMMENKSYSPESPTQYAGPMGPSHTTPCLYPSWSSSDLSRRPSWSSSDLNRRPSWSSSDLSRRPSWSSFDLNAWPPLRDPSPPRKRPNEEIEEQLRKKRSEKETEDSKRQQHLMKNRQAASKCRQKKKEWIAQMQETVTVVSAENQRLKHQVLVLREEILQLKTLLLTSRSGPCLE